MTARSYCSAIAFSPVHGSFALSSQRRLARILLGTNTAETQAQYAKGRCWRTSVLQVAWAAVEGTGRPGRELRGRSGLARGIDAAGAGW